MSMYYDLAVVGAGPGGLMAARAAAEKGLSVALLERNETLSPIKRGCAMVLLTLNEPYFGEEKIHLNRGRGSITFQSSGFSVPYDGPSKDLFAWHLLAPAGSCIRFGDPDKGRQVGEAARTSAVHDKGILLDGVLEQCRGLGVAVMLGADVTGVEKHAENVRLMWPGGAVEAPFVVAADGVNSRLAYRLGMNRQRICYGLMKIQGAELKGVRDFDPNTFYSFLRGRSRPSYSVLLPMAMPDRGCYRAFSVVFDPETDVAGELASLLNNSHFAPSFRDASIMQRTAAVERIFSPMTEPYSDQVLFVGDAAWCQEIEITAAFMCGRQAGLAVAAALTENNVGREGVRSYLDWWNRAGLQTHDYRDYLRNYALTFLMDDDEIDYLFGQVPTTLPALFNPYRALGLLSRELAAAMDRISSERPQIARKIESFSTLSIEALMKAPQRASSRLMAE